MELRSPGWIKNRKRSETGQAEPWSVWRRLLAWAAHLFPVGMPLALGIMLGLILALLIIEEEWIFVPVVLAVIPVVMLLSRNPFTALTIWIMVMPWFRFEGVYKYIYYTVHRFLIPIGLGLYLLNCWLVTGKRSRAKWGWLDWGLVAYLVLAGVSIFVTGMHWKNIFNLQDRVLIPLTGYWLVRFSDAGEKELKTLIPVMLVIGIAEYAISVISWFAPDALPEIWRFRVYGNRTTGTFGQPAVYAYIILTFAVFFYHDAMNRSRGVMRFLEMIAFAGGIFCIFLTFTRGAWLAGIVVVLIVLLIYPRRTAPLVLAVVAIMALLSVSLMAAEFAYASERLQTSDEDADARLVLANAGAKMFLTRPLLGWGYTTYDRYDVQFLERVNEYTPTEWQIKNGTSHHTYLTILAETGAIGFVLYALPTFFWLVRSAQAFVRLPRGGFWSRGLLVLMWAPMLAHVLLAQDMDMRFFTYALTWYWITLGFIANLVSSAPQTRPVAG